MNLHEYQAKERLRAQGLPVPEGAVAADAAEAREHAWRLGGPVAVKAQVLTGGRGKAGGIRLAATPDDAAQAAADILGMDIRGYTVRSVLVERATAIQRELYLGVVLDRAARRPVLIGCRQGGIDIEEVAARDPAAIRRETVEPLLGLQAYQTRRLALDLGLAGTQARALADIATRLYAVYDALDATLVEVNRLAILEDGTLVALDAKINLDDNALFRHPDLAALRDETAETPAERAARSAGLSYVSLAGTIGCLVNGAGLAMATMDVIKLLGGEPANFLDIGGGARADQVELAMRLLLDDGRVRSVLINIFGGITRCDEVARGIVAALAAIGTDVPFVVRLEGTNAAAGRSILSGAHMQTAQTLTEAARLAIAAAGDDRAQAQRSPT